MLQKIKKLWAKLKLGHSTPIEVAAGFALGIFIGMSPFPLQNLLAIGAAYLFRLNLLAAVIGVNFHLVFFPIIPFQYVLEYKIGSALLGFHTRIHPPVEWTMMDVPENLSRWRMFKKILKELIAGWLVLGAPISLAAFVFVWREAKLWKKLPPVEKLEFEMESDQK